MSRGSVKEMALPAGYAPRVQCTAGSQAQPHSGGTSAAQRSWVTESGSRPQGPQGPALGCWARRRPVWNLSRQPQLAFSSVLPKSSGPRRPDYRLCFPSAGADAGEHCGARPEAADPAAPGGGPGALPHGRVAQHAQLVLRPPAPLLPAPHLLQEEPAQAGEGGTRLQRTALS